MERAHAEAEEVTHSSIQGNADLGFLSAQQSTLPANNIFHATSDDSNYSSPDLRNLLKCRTATIEFTSRQTDRHSVAQCDFTPE